MAQPASAPGAPGAPWHGDGHEPLAIVGLACRLPGRCSTPARLWDFLAEGRVASNAVPASRFNVAGHWDGSHKRGTMRPPGGMFLSEDDVDLADFDASFFEIAGAEALATDPNQRQLLEVVYEGLESAGVPMDAVSGADVACFVASFAVDYADLHARDPEDRPGNTGLGTGRAILANRISWFFNLKGPSVTVDTACSGSLIALDLAARALRAREVDAAIVAASNLYMSPEHVIDDALVGQAHSPTGLCHAFDAAADGYVKAEAVSCLVVKRLETALRDRDPIRAVVRGVAINSNGRTNGIGSPSSEAQAAAIRKAYANAGIADLNDTQFLECHGTGTKAGDAIEVAGVKMAFADTRDPAKPLIIGSIKSNVGHAEPAAGLSGLIKTILALEHGMIPGTPLFINPNPKIDFAGAKVRVSRTMLPWPDTDGKPRRASVNSFGYGGANGHAILEEAGAHTGGQTHHVASIRPVDELMSLDHDLDSSHDSSSNTPTRPYTLVLSANDAVSLKAGIAALCDHLVNPRVEASVRDLAYTLGQRRTHLWHRAFVTASGGSSGSTRELGLELQASDFSTAKKAARPPRVGFVFTGQGAQWPQMGRALLAAFPVTTRAVLGELDAVLAGITACDPPGWSLLDELTLPRPAEHLRRPELSQPLVTALQICLLEVLTRKWGVRPSSVVGHSSGEIAAAYAAGLLDRAAAIKAAFFRGRAVEVVSRREGAETDLGMLAVGLAADAVAPFLAPYEGRAAIACYNSPSSLTISGRKDDLEKLAGEVKAAGHFARLLQVDMAYHSRYMDAVGQEYESLLRREGLDVLRPGEEGAAISMFSSVTASKITDATPTDVSYWNSNLLSPVRFDAAVQAMLSQPGHESPDMLIEVGPSGALSGPISQILKATARAGDVSYCAAWSRGADAVKSLFDVAGRLFITGADIDLAAVNAEDEEHDPDGAQPPPPRCIVDLPGYRWNHSVKYWFESAASRDWRFRPFVTHDLIGSKILGTPWTSPTWHKRLSLDDVPWLRDHRMGGDVLMPGAGFCLMAVEAMYQKHTALALQAAPEPARAAVPAPGGVADLAYGLRNVRFERALVVHEGQPVDVFVALGRLARSSADAGWHEFRVSTSRGDDDVVVDHCVGQIRIIIDDELTEEGLAEGDERRAPLRTPEPFSLWYKTQRDVGMDFGPSFRRIRALEATAGQRSCRALVDLTPPPSKWEPQSRYPLHPAVLDACLQALMAPNAANERSLVREIQIPGLANEAIINRMPRDGLRQGLVHARSRYSGRGRLDQAKGIIGDVSLYDADTGAMLMQLRGLNYAKLDADPKPDPHTFDSVQWRPDISLLAARDQLEALLQWGGFPGTLIDLVAHKRPLLKVLEVAFEDDDAAAAVPADGSSLWLEGGEAGARQACTRYDFASANPDALVAAEKRHGAARQDGGYLLADWEKPALGLDTATSARYDLVILQSPQRQDGARVQALCATLEPLLSDGGLVVVLQVGKEPEATTTSSVASQSSGTRTAPASVASSSVGDADSAIDVGTDTPYTRTSQQPHEKQAASPVRAPLTNGEAVPAKPLTGEGDCRRLEPILFPIEAGPATHYLCRLPKTGQSDEDDGPQAEDTTSGGRTLLIAHLSPPDAAQTALLDRLTAALDPQQWRVTTSDITLLPSSDGGIPTTNNTTAILVPDELTTSVLSAPSPAQWTALQALLATGRPLLWLTSGAAAEHPERAMAHGLLRVARRELAAQGDAAPRVVLDVVDANNDDEVSGEAVARAVAAVLALMGNGNGNGDGNGSAVEPEYRLRAESGVLEIPRLVPDAAVNEYRRFARRGLGGPTRPAPLWGTPGTVRLRGERVGALELVWCEEGGGDGEPLKEGYVEVEVEAVGVNFKDVAAVMGIIPEDEHMIGCECAGVVRRVGPGVTKVRVGDRVVVEGAGNYANRLVTVAECVQPFPPWMSFVEAASMPLVYSTAIQGLIHLANLQEGQSVLIHSAAGGVGIAAIQVARYKKAEIFVTVSTEEKREFLSREFGIPRDHMFSSRDARFARQILALTRGRGVDVVLNSLTGDLLDASWRIVADGGTMVEIGKRDILDRNALAMEPFGRNCSFRALDISFGRTMLDARLLGKLLRETFELAEAGHIGPIRPITTYGFDDVPAALACIRRGQHIGKIVIAKPDGDKDVRVPIRPLLRTLQLRADASYLIVGGIKGLCGSLALHMARHGAAHLIVCSRSGIADEASARVVRGCRSYGCEVTEQKGDVCDMEFVRRVFESAGPRPIAGVIQGAMVLRDKPFEAMGLDDYQTAVAAKVAGTWNLHRASLEHAASSAGRPLDFFTLLSSVSGVVGNKGQANYAAANAFLDAFAAHRRALGLPAHSLDLGAVEDVGYIAEQEAQADNEEGRGSGARLADRFRRDAQWTPLDEEALRTAFTVSVLQQQETRNRPLSASHQLVTGIAHPLPAGGGLEDDPRLGYLRGGADGSGDSSSRAGPDGGSGGDDAALQAFHAVLRATKAASASSSSPSGGATQAAAALEKAAVAALAAQTARVLRLEAEVEVGKPLAAYGLDSLSAVELRGWIRARLGAELTTLDVTNARSLVELGEKVVAKLV